MSKPADIFFRHALLRVGTESGLLLYFRPDRVLEADGKTLDCVCAAGPPGFESRQYEGLICV